MVFVQDFKTDLFNTTEANFEAKSLSVFNYQFQHNTLYRQYVNALGINPSQVVSIEQIPFLPISFFKNHKIVSTENQYDSFFESSGTTGSQRSRLYFYDEEFYLKNAVAIFENRFGSISEYTFFFLLPSYLERKSSSLVSMANRFFQLSDQSFGGFYLYDFKTLEIELQKALLLNKRIILWGVTFALLDFVAQLSDELSGLIVFETGGMKGRGKEPLRSEVHQLLKQKLNLIAVYSEYGMTELFSQAYTESQETFVCPPQMKILIRDVEDPLHVHSKIGQRGGINVIDLANIDTCSFIETQDLGMLRNEGFQILGRFDNSDVRGCNLMVLA